MIVSCPKCQRKFQLDPSRVVGDWTPLACRHCGTRFVATVREKPLPSELHGIVLVVAGSSPLRDEMESLLHRLGFAVKAIDQVAAGRHYLGVCVPDILITAFTLPDGNGLDLVRLIRTDEALRACRTWVLGKPADQSATTDSLPDAWIPPDLPLEQLTLRLQTAAASLQAEQSHLSEYERLHRRSERLARTILSDIILYNPEEVEKGIREGTFHELLCEELEDARRYFAEQVHPDVLREKNDFETLLESYLTEQRRKLVQDIST
ncbi:MAG: zinc-ribbon domain-containing protein [Blastocatellia bacterium]|nr:zinc-ribbon domain-containing protein [Blastocatellia bacterium]